MMRKCFIGISLLAALLLAACKSKQPARLPPTVAPQQAQAEMQAGTATVFVRGEVRNPVVPWSEDLKLSQALVAADYLGRKDPFSIYILRRGKMIYVSPRRLLSGTQDPLLEPGDVVELRR